MKKLLFLAALFLFNIQINAQDPDPDLFDQTWYLYVVEDSEGDTFYVEGYQPYGGDPVIPQITPYVIIEEESLNFNGLGICNTFNGTLAQSPSHNSFRTVTADQTNFECGFYEDLDEPTVIGPFGWVDPDPEFYTIIDPQITTDSDGFQTLIYGTQPFVAYVCRNTPILSNEDFTKTAFSLYPNPTSGSLNFSSINTLVESVRVYSVTGTMVLQLSIHSSSNSMDVSSLTNGLYFVEMISAERQEIHKILKN